MSTDKLQFSTSSYYSHSCKRASIEAKDRKEQKVTQTETKNNAFSRQPALQKAHAARVDRIEISHKAKAEATSINEKNIENTQKRIVDELRREPGVQRFLAIKQQVQDGTYSIDAQEIAKKIMQKEFSE